MFGEKCSYANRQLDEQTSKRAKNNGDTSAVAMLKSTRQLGCVSQDMERDFRVLHSTQLQEEDWSKIKILSLNSLARYRNCKMKLIV